MKWHSSCEVMVVLSCHSSSQGQVFSCTPSEISKQFDFEEFCSIHDFVCSLQDILQKHLKIVHISSCFALKLDESHKDWPVDSSWISDKLNCVLSGSAKEVYETGSQTADLYLVLKIFQSNKDMVTGYMETYYDASMNLFPDLVLEMGLCYADPSLLTSMLENPEKEDQVTTQAPIDSFVHLVIVCDKKDSPSVHIKEALVCNLKTRCERDFVTGYTVLDQGTDVFEVEDSSKKLFIIVLAKVDESTMKSFISQVVDYSTKPITQQIYGLHFNTVSENVNKIENEFGIDTTGFIACEDWTDTFPVLLYLTHLALGENGIKRKQDGESASSNWSLHEVFNETSHVLEGLCKKCNFQQLSKRKTIDRPKQVAIVDFSLVKNGKTSSVIDNFNNEVKDNDEPQVINMEEVKDPSIELQIEPNSDLGKIKDPQKDNFTTNRGEESSQEQKGTDKNEETEQQTEICNTNKTLINAKLKESIQKEENVPVFHKDLRDVPLMANVNEVLINHYALDLVIDFEEKSVTGKELLFLKPANDEVARKAFQMCLDCTLIDIVSVEEVILPEDFEIHFHKGRCCCDDGLNQNVISSLTKSTTSDKNLNEFNNKADSCNIDIGKEGCTGSHNINENSLHKETFNTSIKKCDQENSCHKNDYLIDIRDDNSDENIPISKEEISSDDVKKENTCSSSIDGVDEKNSTKHSFCSSCRFLQNYDDDYNNKSRVRLNYNTLPYAVYGWCVRIWNVTSAKYHWPKCVYIRYRTKAIGPSLTWCKDEEGNDCCYTPGAFINNRSMMPCQEPPVAMSTWQATIRVPKSYVALSSGNVVECKQSKLRQIYTEEKELFYFEMSVPLPSSTLAFAFGKFSKGSKSVVVNCLGRSIPVTVYASAGKIDMFEKEYLQLSAEYLRTACEMLGAYPFSRLDLLVMPRSFACMGLESPNMMFLSQSVLCGDQSMSTRIAHEITHAWFGLLIGAKDWTEEWLSEGFATYLEDRILSRHQKMSEVEFLDHSKLLQLLRLKVLKGELEQTEDENLKLLRPKRKRNYTTAIEAIKKDTEEDSKCIQPQPYQTVPNAAIASKKWSQIHYLKGYFLLMYMAKDVGFEKFDEFLKAYVEHYRGKLVNSEMFFDFYTNYFQLESNTKENLTKWLEKTDIPKEILEVKLSESLKVKEVEEEFAFWKKSNSTNKRFKSRRVKRKSDAFNTRKKLTNSNQKVLLLEKLLSIDDIVAQTMTQLNLIYQFQSSNAEIRHRWCELIIKHGCLNWHDEVRRFLTEDQGMGIYLFGELMIWGRKKQRTMAHDLFHSLKGEMDRSTRETVLDLLDVGSSE